MSVDQEALGRDDLPEVIATLTTWEGEASYPLGLHAGDVGWHARLPDQHFDDTMRVFRRRGEWVAVGLFEPGLVRPRIAPGLAHDREVAAAVAEAARTMPAAELCTDAEPGSAYRTCLSAAGWTLDPDPWVCLYRHLRVDDGELGDDFTRSPASADDVVDRVAVQRAAFDGSTFTLAAWRRMASGAGFAPELEMLSRDHDGVPVAAGTGWSAGPGKCGILEPVGTHRDHRGSGHGRRVVLAIFGALARAGASGVSVHTPGANAAALAAYASCGMRPIETTQALVRPSCVVDRPVPANGGME